MHLVIGGSKGIGLEIVRSLSLMGERVLSLSRTPPLIASDKVLRLGCDLGDSLSIASCLMYVESMKHEIHTVSFCAALQDREVSQWQRPQYERHMKINCFGQIELYEGLCARGCVVPRPTLLYFGSQAGDEGSSWAPAYAISKAAMWTWLKSKYLSMDEDKRPVLNRILPGRVNTPGNPRRVLSVDDKVRYREPIEIMAFVLELLELRPPTNIVLRTLDLGLVP